MTNGTGVGARPARRSRTRKLIMLWGDEHPTHQPPPVADRSNGRAADGARLVVIDPIRTMTADDSRLQFVQPLPGTDIALMLAMMHVLIRDDLVDHEWVDAHTHGFDELAGARGRVDAGVGAPRCAASTPTSSSRWPATYGTIRPAAIRTLDRRRAPRERRRCSSARSPACRRSSGRGASAAAVCARSVGVWQDQLDRRGARWTGPTCSTAATPCER